ncbi:hypothetical protein A9Q86_14200 [Flavobacteriales bacterium 33_180_T64]|nr:hypothetical protein A9Q86_14200 [Flavobacteriales bacterium 33_180_T64]
MEDVRKKNWFGRNWLWALPVGGCFTVILLFVFGLGAVFFGVSKIIETSTPYEYALHAAQSNSAVQNSLGKDIDTDGVFEGNLTFNNDSGEANFRIPIKGEKGKGTIVVIAERENDEWVYEKLYVLIKKTQEEINLKDKNMEGY